MKKNEEGKYPEIKKLMKSMEKCQDSKRFQHTLGVSYTAAAMAMCYNQSVKQAQIAGLLHDCAKEISDEKKIAICKKNNILITDIEIRNPYLLHAKVGAYLAKEEYGIEDADIIHAISSHTTGRPNMSILEKIIFIADYIEPGRNKAANLDLIRNVAFQNLEECMILILKDTMEYISQNNQEMDPMTKDTLNFYVLEKERRSNGTEI